MSSVVASDEVIRLRPLSPTDAEAHVAGCDRAVLDSVGAGEPPSATDVRHWLAGNARAWDQGEQVVDLGVVCAASHTLCGVVGMQAGLDYLEPGQTNLTYSLYPSWRGRGYATRAVRLVMDVARRREHVAEFVIRAAAWIGESIRVAQRLGFTHSHTSDDEHGQLEWFTLSTRATAAPAGPELRIS